ncbi:MULTISPECIES: bifunctional diguanylate cyclase/phosphodiesterase [unclassified Vibrio]|uniref:putative bifunctional diguanylate cyclase/phosphodiesterase n=1 Tax=unclassified Vibrio TaxID=2614977 RepID=UPI000C81BE44|nr:MULTISPECIES: EAL domain-containing protein [unclassified Vibrio]PMI21863.1 diguanylate phosphodiesterase [Vibrio sp. 10N.286.46.E10]PMI97341.1 diguanylate phosphodiesterase [Vibrio sp. 10N.286.45.E10]PTP06424.1 diguanylate phosphodiesterase [Vibrio sp. 10N.286.45.A3]PTP15231.1 diguanylate phosphodiesterase [Vibrio sp. 10N.286.51.C3]PTQ22724.1 diguanylate phosphodiesterase [Vibrio sp. 10N.286.46.E10]
MKLPQINITQRLIISNLVSLLIVSLAVIMVIRSLYYVESTLKTETSTHVSDLIVNSEISRRVFTLTSRVKLLEQTFLFSETTLSEEAFNVDFQLQRLRDLSTNEGFSQKIDAFIDNFHRFLGSSLALNRILKQTNQIDAALAEQLNQLEFAIADSKLRHLDQPNFIRYNNELDLINMLRESFLTSGKMVGDIHSRITPETEKVLLIEVEKELDIFLLHLENVDIGTAVVIAEKKRIHRTVKRYNAALKRIRANLEQRWLVMASLLEAQGDLLEMVENTESRVQSQALALTDQLEKEIGLSRLNAIVISFSAVVLSMLLVNHVVRHHIRKPLNALRHGFDRLESGSLKNPINLGRSDEWSHLEKAYNDMASRLSEAYLDLTEEKKNFDFLAHHDPLTNLANRLLATKQLDKEIKISSENQAPFLLFYLDIDEFKTINDSLGHAPGDNLLVNVSDILSNLVGDKGFVARMGGDEFLVVYSNVGLEEGEPIADRLNQALRKPYYIDDNSIFVSASIGVCEYPTHGLDRETLIRNADTAMYHAKRNGRDQYRVYADEMTHEVNDLIETNMGLHQAIANDELEVFFQPKVDLDSQDIIGAEALIRWRHPKLGLLPPIDFLEVAEKSDLIIDIDKWVFKKVANLITEWQRSGIDLQGVIFSINFSARMFYMTDLAEQLQVILDETDCQPHQLLLEITERDMMRDFETCSRTIEVLHSKGYKIAIDDFGTGYSSLSVLKNLSADCVKLDRSFIEDINSSKVDYEITCAVLKLAQILNFSVIAEGLETQNHVKTLRQIGCKYAQGYFFARPLPTDDWVSYFLLNSEQSQKEA